MAAQPRPPFQVPDLLVVRRGFGNPSPPARSLGILDGPLLVLTGLTHFGEREVTRCGSVGPLAAPGGRHRIRHVPVPPGCRLSAVGLPLGRRQVRDPLELFHQAVYRCVELLGRGDLPGEPNVCCFRLRQRFVQKGPTLPRGASPVGRSTSSITIHCARWSDPA